MMRAMDNQDWTIWAYRLSGAVLLALGGAILADLLMTPNGVVVPSLDALIFVFLVLGAPATALGMAAVYALVFSKRPTRLIQAMTHLTAVVYSVLFYMISKVDSL